MSIAPGWYKDPAEPTVQRWWDGEGWIGEPIPADATPPPGPPEPGQPPSPGATLPGTASDLTVPPDRTGAGERAGTSPAGPTASPPSATQAPSAAAGGPPPRPYGHQLATLGARFIARIVDIAIVFLLNVAVNGWFVYQYWNEISPAVSELWERGMAGENSFTDLPEVGDQAGTLQLIILVIAAALWFAYEVPAVANTGQTPGKRLLGIRVVRLEGAKQATGAAGAAPASLGFGRSFRRWNTMGLPTLLWWCFGIGFLLQLVDAAFAVFDRPMQQALHDKSALTAVIVTEPPGTDAFPTDPPEEAPDGPADPS